MTVILVILLQVKPVLSEAQTNPFISFSVEPESNGNVIIQWKISPESDTLPFVVERSADTAKWETIAELPAYVSHHYSTIGAWPGEGIVYYRVKQLYNEQAQAVTQIKWIQSARKTAVYIWPNPARGLIHVKTAFEKGNIDIINAEGRLLWKIVMNGYVTDIPVTLLSKGIYILQIRHNNEVFTERFIRE
jgi:hypothetical protein